MHQCAHLEWDPRHYLEMEVIFPCGGVSTNGAKSCMRWNGVWEVFVGNDTTSLALIVTCILCDLAKAVPQRLIG